MFLFCLIKGVGRLKKLIQKYEIEDLSKYDVVRLFQEMLNADRGNKLKIYFKDYAVELDSSNMPLSMSLNLKKLKRD